MKTFRSILAAHVCAIAAAACPLANASLIQQPDGTSFVDTDTGYLWQTLGQYDGMDYGSAVKRLPAGYHVASETELATLTAAAPAAADGGNFDQDAAAMGAPFDPDNPMIWGFYGDGTTYAWKTDWEDSWTSSGTNSSGWYDFGLGAVPAGRSGEYLSIFAVDTDAAQATVPEPATLALFGLGLAGLARRRRARR